jgi:hypothetical protein
MFKGGDNEKRRKQGPGGKTEAATAAAAAQAYYGSVYRTWRRRHPRPGDPDEARAAEQIMLQKAQNAFGRTYRTGRTALAHELAHARKHNDEARRGVFFARAHAEGRAARLLGRWTSRVPRTYLLAADALLLMLLAVLVIGVGYAFGLFRNAGRVPHSLDEAAASLYTRTLGADMAREARELARRPSTTVR